MVTPRQFLALFLVISTVLMGGCTGMRVFQAKVPPPVVKADPQLEAERAAADLIARKIETPVELKPVAASLSASLGAPKKSLVDVKVFDLPNASTHATGDLNSGILQMQKQLAALNAKLTVLQGKEIDGTGVSVLGPGMMALVIGLIALSMLCPPAMTLMFFALRRVKAAAGIVVKEMESAADAPETAAAIAVVKKRISKSMGDHAMSTKHLKATVLDLKKP